MTTNVVKAVTEHPKDISIEMLKFFAAIIIVNSHMGKLYVHFPQLATGGAIGDAIFFFCSGYTLFLSRRRSFDNYYKRRIVRIYPAVFAWAILSSFFLDNKMSMKEIVLSGGGWFVSCIMIYYILFWFVHRYCMGKLNIVLGAVFGMSVIWFFLFDSNSGYINIYGEGTARFIFYFGFMLFGGIVGCSNYIKVRPIKTSTIMFCLSIIAFYSILMVSSLLKAYWQVQILTLVAIGGGVFYGWSLCKSSVVEKLYTKYKIFGFVGGLCLEMYIVQFSLFTTKMNFLFPLNLLLMLAIVIGAAYLLKCSTRLFEQTFRVEDIDWRKIIKM